MRQSRIMIGMLVVMGFVSLLWSAGVGVQLYAAQTTGCENDFDCDGLTDDREDFDGDGHVDVEAGETDSKNPDSDADGLTDGEERLHIGRIDEILEAGEFSFKALGMLDPMNPDSDGDCIPDGVEVGITKAETTRLLKRIRRRPRVKLTARCEAILAENSVARMDNAIPYDADERERLTNMAMLFDSDPTTRTDPTNDDSDGDGLIDGLEDVDFDGQRGRADEGDDETFDDELVVWVETDPNLPDSDGDGLIDGEEGDRNDDDELGADESDPLLGDTDGDGVSDGDEDRAGTNRNVCDTDGDGLSDGVEMGRIQPEERNGCHGLQAAGTNYRKPNAMDPLNPDSDGDGLTDGEEDINGNGWVDPEDADPSISDTDGDGLSDGCEALGDFDGDGIADFDLRLVHGGKGCNPPAEIADIDCDGVPNFRDDDSDEDGCPDAQEGGWLDMNADEVPDVYDGEARLCPEEVVSGGGGGSPGGSVDPEEEAQALPSLYGADGSDGGACSLHASEIPGGGMAIGGILLITIGFLGILRASARYR